jgi:hypothetical protein
MRAGHVEEIPAAEDELLAGRYAADRYSECSDLFSLT